MENNTQQRKMENNSNVYDARNGVKYNFRKKGT